MAAEISAARTFRNEPRRTFSAQYKRELVEIVLASPTSLARVAREHDLNQNQLTRWRREYEQGKYAVQGVKGAALVPVCMAPETTGATRPARATPAAASHDSSLSVQLRLSKGTVVIDGVDEPLLHRLIEAMQ